MKSIAPMPDLVLRGKNAEARALHRFMELYRAAGRTLLREATAVDFGVGDDSFHLLLGALGWSISTRSLEQRDGRLDETGADLAIAIDVFDQSERPSRVAAQLRDAVKPAGRLYFESAVLNALPGWNEDELTSSGARNIASEAFITTILAGVGFSAERVWRSEGKFCGVYSFTAPSGGEPRLSWGLTQRMRALFTLSAILRKTVTLHKLFKAWQLLSVGGLSRSNRFQIGNARARAFSRVKSAFIAAVGVKSVHHFGVHGASNAGDIVLLEAVRKVLSPTLERPWISDHVHRPLTDDKVADLNRHSAGLIVGGGGLFLPDTNPNLVSGWQWPARPEKIVALEVPLAVFAVGYNLFRGQSRFPAVFSESLEALAEKSCFLGIRNHGSIAALKSYLPERLHAKLRYQPCPTTVLSFLRRQVNTKSLDRRPPRMVFNVAFDRFGYRCGERLPEILGAIASLAKRAGKDGWHVVVASHVATDSAICPYFDKAGISFEVTELWGKSAKATIDCYEGADFVVAMRGHAQMIPFGLGVPVLSVATHDKLGWFLNDIGHPEWLVDAKAKDFGENLLGAYETMSANLGDIRAAIAEARAALWSITSHNVAEIRAAFQAVP